MKKVLSIALLLTGISFASFAQENTVKNKEGRQRADRKEMVQKSPEEMAKFRTERLDKIVKLTDAQRNQVYALYLKEAQTHKDMKSGQKMTKEAQANVQGKEGKKKDGDMRKKGKEASRAELNKILTPEQQALLTEHKKNNDHNKNSRGKDSRGKDSKGHDSKKDMKDGSKRDRK